MRVFAKRSRENLGSILSSYAGCVRASSSLPANIKVAARPGLDALFRRDSGEGKRRIFRRVRVVVERYGYGQREVAEYLGVHYSSVSRMLRKVND